MKLDLNIPETIFGVETSLFKIILLPLPLIIGFVLSLNLVIMPKINEINTLNTSVADVKDKTAVVVSKKNYLMSINKDQLKKDASYLQTALLDKDKTYFLVGAVKAIADNHGFQVKSFSISPGKLKNDAAVQIASKDVMTRIPITVVLVGPKEKQLDLVLALEKSLPILTIDQFEIANSQGISELDLGISAYYISADSTTNIANLGLDELKLKKEESELLSKINQFNLAKKESTATDSGTYTKYQRPNPFSL